MPITTKSDHSNNWQQNSVAQNESTREDRRRFSFTSGKRTKSSSLAHDALNIHAIVHTVILGRIEKSTRHGNTFATGTKHG